MMTFRKRCAGSLVLATVACAWCVGAAWAADSAKASSDSFELKPAEHALLAQADPAKKEATETKVVERQEVETAATEEPSIPISFNVTYYLVSDYVFRGVNFSEYAGEGREKPNHQMTTSLSYSFGDFGTVGLDTFWQWYADQEKLNPYSKDCFAEYDFYIWYEYEIKPIFTTARLSWNFYEYPGTSKLYNSDARPENNNYDRTTEWQITLTHNDAWMWKWLFPKNEDGVLNPMFSIAQDVGVGAGATWMEMGISHPFTFEALPDLTVTPSYKLTAEGHGYTARILDRQGNRNTTRLTTQVLGLNVGYDLTKILHLPKWAGSVALNGFLYYSDAFSGVEDDKLMQDEFYGGMSVGWTWGG